MSWGGARKGAGRKKSEIAKKMRGFRLTDEEWEFMKEALNKYRNGNDAEEPASQLSKDFTQVQQPNPTATKQGASLLAHLEHLYKEQYKWLLEYRDYLKDESYQKHTLEEITLHQEMIHLQILTLIPHLQRLNFSEEVKLACSPLEVAFIHPVDISEIGKNNDFYVKSWKEPENLTYNEVNSSLVKSFEAIKWLNLEIKELEKKLHKYDW